MLESVTLEPEGECWAHALRDQSVRGEAILFDRPISEWQQETQNELFGHRAERPIIATGHQAEFWHPGILAKFVAAEMLAAQVDAEVVELVPDQDTNEPLTIRIPRFRNGRLQVENISLAEEGASDGTMPTAGRAPVAPRAASQVLPDSIETVDTVRRGVSAMVESLNRHRSADSLAEQVTQANLDLRTMMNGDAETPRPRVIMATQLTRTRLWARLMEAMRSDPDRVFDLYNRAVSKHSHAHVGPLTGTGADREMPVWITHEDGTRHAATVSDLDRDPTSMWPRALLMSGFMRLAVCDFFIHGRSGAVYDQATEDWLANWLGVSLTPAGMATADVYLNFPGFGVDSGDLARARWNAHHIRHHLAAYLDDPELTERRRALLRRIAEAPRRSAERAAAFAELHRFQSDLNQAHQEVLAEADREVETVRIRMKENEVVRDRSWAFALYPPESIRALKAEIAAGFGADSGGSSVEAAPAVASCDTSCRSG